MTTDPTALDRTHEASATSWVESANAAATDFPIQNLPYGVFRRAGSGAFRAGVAIGDQIIDLSATEASALFAGAAAAAPAARESTLNALAALPAATLRALRLSIFDALADPAHRGLLERALVPMAQAEYAVPFTIGDFTDFYASIFHATRVGTMYRPQNPLMPNYKYVPVAYHGRSSTIVVDGTPVRRPCGQLRLSEDAAPVYEPCRRMDYEAEVGFYVGPPTAGETLDPDAAAEHVFGFTVLNDWSARDIQTWEYQPLGPFLGKNFATTVSPWVVTLDALRPFRTPALVREPGDPLPLPHLSSANDTAIGGVDIAISVAIRSARMRAEGLPALHLSTSSFGESYWTFAQMLVHHASNGCVLRTGDLLGSGTMSGSGDDPSRWGSLVELTHNGRDALKLPSGEIRTFIADGDEIIMRGHCARPGYASIGFGTCSAVIQGVH